MGFLSPLWLASGLLALAVIALHTLRRERREVPSLILWRQLPQTSRARPRLRPPDVNLLMLLQVLAVAALALALAQPVVGTVETRPAHRVFLLDASASMTARDVEPSRFAAAGAALGDMVRGLPDGTRVTILEVGDNPRFVAARQSDRASIESVMATLEPSGGEADWSAAAGRLAEVVRPDEATRLVALSDTDVSAIAGAYPGTTFQQVTFGTAEPANAALSATAQLVDSATHKWTVSGEVAVSGDATWPASIQVAFLPAGETTLLDWSSIALAPPATPDAAGPLAFSTSLELPADGIVQLSIPDDAAPFDDSIALALRTEPHRLRVLYLGPGNPLVEQALLASPDVDLETSQAMPATTAGYDLVVADNVALPRRPDGNVLWLGTARTTDDPPLRHTAMLPTDWQAAHPLSRDIAWSRTPPLDGYEFAHLAGATTVLAYGGMPLVEARTTPAGREVRVALRLDRDGWAGTGQFAVLVNNLLDWIVPARGAGVTSCVTGRPCRIAAAGLSTRITDATGQVVWTPPAGDWLLDEAVDSFVPSRPGLYLQGRDALAVNAPPEESAVATAAAATSGPLPDALPLAPVGIAAALLLLLVEFILYARSADRPLRARTLRRGVPGAMRRRLQVALRFAALAAGVAALVLLPLPVPDVARDIVLVASGQGDAPAARGRLAATTQCQPLLARRAGLVTAAAVPVIATDADCGPAGGTAATQPGADLDGALDLAAAMLRHDRPGRLLLASDGNRTTATHAALLPALLAARLPVDVAPADPAGDSYVGPLDLPRQLFAGDRPLLVATLHASTAQPVHLAVRADGMLISEQDTDLVAGANRVDIELPAVTEGRHRYSVEMVAAGDPVAENNVNAIAATAAPLPAVAIVTAQADWGQRFADALAVQGIRSTIMRPRDAPFMLEGWLDYAAVVLLNVPAIDLDTRQQDQLESFVKDYGRGLLLLGGENTFGPGGYFRTPLERLSPLSSRIPDDLPAAALVFVLDRSGSMQAIVGDGTRLDIARQATISAVELLNPESQVGVVAFDTQAQVVLPLQDRKDEAALAAALDRLSPGGGTSIYPGLDEGLNQMEHAESSTRHIILMSDGLSQPGDFPALAERARRMGVTISAVAIGSGADVGKLEALARDGGGAFHVTQDFRALPSILSQEAMMLANDALETGTRQVSWADRSAPFLSGLPDQLPPIDSFVLTTGKPEAKVHVTTIDDKGNTVPILASWGYGNGEVIALATHGAGPGSARWAAMPQYPLLWGQAVRQLMSTSGTPGLSLFLGRDGDDVRVEARAFDKVGAPRDGLDLSGQASATGAAPVSFRLSSTGAGSYAGRFATTAPGDYAVTVSDSQYTAQGTISLAYPAIYDFSRASRERLEALAMMTGGDVLADDAAWPSAGFGWRWVRAWQPWALLAFALFIGDLVLRYGPRLLAFPRSRPQPAGVTP